MTKRVRKRRALLARRIDEPCRRCGTVFWNKSSFYCSHVCGRAAVSARFKGGRKHPAVIETQKLSPLTRTGSLEHRRARDWSLRDPEGTIWNVRNLSEFVRSHPDLFLPEDVRPIGKACRALVGLGQLRRGRRMRDPMGSWKGWTWAGVRE